MQSWYFAKFCLANDICTAGWKQQIFCKSGSNFEIGQTVRLNLTGLKLWVYSARLCGGRAELSDRMGKTRPPMSAKDSTRKFRQKGCQHKIGRDQFSCVFFCILLQAHLNHDVCNFLVEMWFNQGRWKRVVSWYFSCFYFLLYFDAYISMTIFFSQINRLLCSWEVAWLNCHSRFQLLSRLFQN